MPEQQYEDARSAGVSKQRSFPLPNGKTIELGQLGLAQYKRVEQEALAEHKRNYIKTFTDNADLLPKGIRVEMIREAMHDASRMTLDDLGEKDLVIPVTKGGEIVFGEDGKVKTTTQRVPYSAWWMSTTVPGRILAIWLSMQRIPSQKNITQDEAGDLLSEAMMSDGEAILEEAAQVVGEISQSHLAESAGNSTTPETPGTPTAQPSIGQS